MSRLLACAAALLALACAARGPGAIARAALPLAQPWPESLPDAAAARLRSAVAGRRFIAVAEGDHNVADKLAYRLALLRELVAQRGVRQLALELGASDAGRVDAYLETGDERWLERVVLFGYVGESPREQRDLAFYTRLPAAQRQATARLGEAEKQFFRELRALGEPLRAAGERLRVFGFDLDSTPGGGYEDARRLAGGCAPGPAPAQIAAALTQPQGIAGLDEVRRLEALVARADALAPELDAACGRAARERLRESIEVLAASFRHFLERSAAESQAGPGALLALREVYERREQRMAERFAGFAAALPDGAPVVLLLHNLHAARDSEALRFGRAPADERFWQSLVSRIETQQPGQTYVIWLLYARGTRLDARVPGLAAQVQPQRASLEARLERLPAPFLVFLDDVPAPSPFDAPSAFGTDSAYASGVLRGRVDALVFLPRAQAP